MKKINAWTIFIVCFMMLLLLSGIANAQELLIQPQQAEPQQAMPTETTENVEAPDFCDNMQTPMTMKAEKLDAHDFPYLEKWLPDSRFCFYSLRDTNSFLLSKSIGTFGLNFDEKEEPWRIIVTVFYEDKQQTIEAFKDWSSVAISMLTGTDLITAQEYFDSSTVYGIDIYNERYILTTKLDRENMWYQFTVTDGFYQK